jgi:isopentenyldiphosphate isomerase
MMDSGGMILDRVDSKNHVIGRVARGAVFHEKANFRVVHVIIQDQRGQILVQKIANGLRHEGAWGSSVAGYVKAGETYRHAALRKLKEEIGLMFISSAARLKSHGTTSMIDEGCQKFIAVYSTRHDGVIKLIPRHASGIEFLALDEIVEQHEARRRALTPTFMHVMRYLYPHAF